MKSNKRWVRSILLPIISTLVFGGLYYYLAIPPMNIKSADFWSFWIVIVIAFFVFRWVFCHKFGAPPVKASDEDAEEIKIKVGENVIPLGKATKRVKFWIKIGIGAVAVVAVVLIGVWISSSEIFNAQQYHDQLTVEEGNFQDDVAEIPFSQIPVVDKATAIKLGNRKLGEVVSLVSQFEISDMYTQINYQNTPTRVSPLVYSDIIKWFTNQADGIPYYIRINMATQETELVELDQPMKYSIYDHFNRNLLRHLRFAYPTAMFDDPVFEIDDSGNPYWVVPIYDYEIGLVGGKDIVDVVIVDATNGSMTRYAVDDVPQWVDNAYPADLLNTQANNWGKYANGWFNSIFGQRDVFTTTEGYNSLAIDDDLWMYTGLTSVTGDQSNIGFILVNMRTKETKYYQINGADEESAMRSAEGKVQEKAYDASFPILINVANQPTYFMSLKDDAGLIKQYAFVSVEQYQIVGVGDSVEAARDSYVKQLAENGQTEQQATTQVSGQITSIASAVVDGNTNYYFTLNNDPNVVYVASISLNQRLPMLGNGDMVSLEYSETGDVNVRNVKTLTLS